MQEKFIDYFEKPKQKKKKNNFKDKFEKSICRKNKFVLMCISCNFDGRTVPKVF